MNKITFKSDEERRAFCLGKGIDASKHCCLDMAWFISEPIEWELQGSNPVILWISAWNEYRIDISHRGNSSTIIQFCPWCGKQLPKSKQCEWYQVLWAMGYQDPSEQEVPEEFNTDSWWRGRPS